MKANYITHCHRVRLLRLHMVLDGLLWFLNALWVAKQMGHLDTEMIIKNYGRWIPDKSTVAGYTTVNEWVSPLTALCK